VQSYVSPLPAPPAPDPAENLTDPLESTAADSPDRVLYARLVDGSWTDVTAREFHHDVTEVARGLIATGIQPGDRVGLMSKTRYEWTVTDYAIWYAGAVTVPIYETSSADQVRWILSDSGARAVVVETADHVAALDEIRGDVPTLAFDPVVLDEGGLDAVRARAGEVDADDLIPRRRTATGGSTATIVYTSGTTGRPKGCVITHANLLFLLRAAISHVPEAFVPGSSTLLFLPLAHVFARIIPIASVMGGLQVAFATGIPQVSAELQSFRPTFLVAMPRVFEKLYNTAYARAAEKSPVARRIFNAATTTAVEWSEAIAKGRPSRLLAARHALFERLVYAKIEAAIGGRVRYAISGSAPFPDRLSHFFRGVGINVVEGYGLTECCAATTVGRFSNPKVGTVGQPLPGVHVRVAEDGELQLKGDHVFAGYLNDPESTAAAFTDDGWLRTGDLASLDGEGFVRITGRSKEILVTASGKNVSPAPLEDVIAQEPLVGQALVIGDGQPYVAALVTLDKDAVTSWARRHGKAEDMATLARDPEVRAHVQAAVDKANKTVSRAESVRRFEILPEHWSAESGELTPSLKLKRAHVFRQHSDVIEKLYASKREDT
jgi:long-chain acyl-CoA synthetase